MYRVRRSQSVAVRAVHDAFFTGPVAPVDAVVDEFGAGVGTAQMLEPHFVDIDGDDFFRIISVHGNTEVGHVTEVGGTVDVIHLHPPQFTLRGLRFTLRGCATRMTRHLCCKAKRLNLFSSEVMYCSSVCPASNCWSMRFNGSMTRMRTPRRRTSWRAFSRMQSTV